MNRTVFVIIATAIVCAVIFLYQNGLKNYYSQELYEAVKNRDYNRFNELAENKKVKKYISPFTIDYMRFNIAIYEQDKNKVIEAFDAFTDMRMSESQRSALYSRAMSYFITVNDSDRCRICYENLQKLKGNETVKEQSKNVYEVMVNHETDNLNDLLSHFDTAEGSDKAVTASLIAVIYGYLKDDAKRIKYEDIAKQYLSKDKQTKNS